jgi:16S rRNA G1207 methylase RsmC
MSHYFITPETVPDTFPIQLQLAGHTYNLVSSPGVFSAHRLDKATEILLRTAPLTDASGQILDLGCGIGPITIALATASPTAHITAIDTNQQALRLTQANVDTVGIADQVTVTAPDDVNPDLRFDQIWSNPPIRIGKPALHALLKRWLSRLTDTGVAYLVIARHLGGDSLASWLTTQGWTVQRLRSSQGFRVLAVTVPH